MNDDETVWVRSMRSPQRIHVLAHSAAHEPPRGLCGASPTELDAESPHDAELTRCALCALLRHGHPARPPRTLRDWIEHECADHNDDHDLPWQLRELADDADPDAVKQALRALVTGLTKHCIDTENTLRAMRAIRPHQAHLHTVSTDLVESLVALDVAFTGLGHAEAVLRRYGGTAGQVTRVVKP